MSSLHELVCLCADPHIASSSTLKSAPTDANTFRSCWIFAEILTEINDRKDQGFGAMAECADSVESALTEIHCARGQIRINGGTEILKPDYLP
jgi:hypothetical protein